MPLYVILLRSALAAEVAAVLPIILLLLATGITVATIQSALQLEDTALSLVPRIVIMVLIAVFGGFGAVGLFKALVIAWIGHAALLVHQPWS